MPWLASLSPRLHLPPDLNARHFDVCVLYLLVVTFFSFCFRMLGHGHLAPASLVEGDGPYDPLAHDMFVELAQMIHFFYMYFDSCNPYSLAPTSLVPCICWIFIIHISSFDCFHVHP
jgi:hypothetical protein